jgi:hypothetical protein
LEVKGQVSTTAVTCESLAMMLLTASGNAHGIQLQVDTIKASVNRNGVETMLAGLGQGERLRSEDDVIVVLHRELA